ncbi:olfactory receptor 14J1-like [Acomys russatus]|uniref:olfactory receptor 14J1-like n=1 Tax=Acomys russatus TaxID=60746 RepID=UPI0021E20966|nr:olfactory receptor 14J1-like [Acomys russatus]
MTARNITTMGGFLLMGFSDNRELQILHALLFMVIYLLDFVGNFVIIIITTLDPQLQSPMYYFLKHLSLLDLSSLSVTVPQVIDSSLAGSGYISYSQCMLQVFFFTALAWGEMAILTVMSYDRYVAVCFPLHYEAITSPRKCKWAVTIVWLSSGITGTLYIATTVSIRFCKTKLVHQFFCDVSQLLKLSCSGDYFGVMEVSTFMSVMAFACFMGIGLSYGQIFSTVVTIPSAESRTKVFSTCLPHLFIVSFFISTGICAYLKPNSDSPTAVDLMLSIFYTVLPPTLNPVIYSLRNESLKRAIRKLLLSEKFIGKKLILFFC